MFVYCPNIATAAQIISPDADRFRGMPEWPKRYSPPFDPKAICVLIVGIRLGVGVIGGVGVEVSVGVGTMEADAEAEGVPDTDAFTFVVIRAVDVAVLDVVCGGLLAAWLLLIDEVHPAIIIEETIHVTRISAVVF